jgi:uncharacterized protein (TIGR02246 family)
MYSEDFHALIEAARQSWLSGNAAAFAALFASDGLFIVPGQRWVGRSAIEQAAAEYASTHVVESIEVQQVLLASNQAAIEWVWQDRARGQATTQTARDAIFIDTDAGQITRWREYIDAESA